MLHGPFFVPFKKGERVLVAYDGKGGRCTAGKIVRMRGCAILVRFIQFGAPEDGIIDEWFMPYEVVEKYAGSSHDRCYGKYVKQRKSDNPRLMSMLFGLKGDWYSVYKWDKDVAKRSGIGSRRSSPVKNVCNRLKQVISG